MWLFILAALPLLALVISLAILLAGRRAATKRLRGLAGRHVLVTGGSSGIGLAVAQLAASHGARVTILARDAGRLASARESVLRAGRGGCLALSCDVSECGDDGGGAVVTAVERAERENGPIFLLICCAGFALAERMEQMPLSVHRRIMQVNYFGVLSIVHAVVPGMRERQSGHICIVSSVAGLVGLWGFSGYCSSKFALVGLSQVLAQELRPHVTVTLCCPPDTDTPGLAEENRTKPAETRLVSAAGGLASADQVAARLLEDALAGRADSLTGVEGFLVGSLALGTTAPAGRWPELLVQLVTLPLMRLAMVFTHWNWDRQLHNLAQQRQQNKKHE